MLGDAGRCAKFWTKGIVHAFWFEWHVLVVWNRSSVDAFHGAVQIRATADFLLNEFVDKIRVLS